MKKRLDPRIKMIMILFATLYITLQFGLKLEFYLIIIYLLPFMLSGLYKYWIVFFVLFIAQVTTSIYLTPIIHTPFLIYIISFLSNGVRLLLPGIIAGVYALKTTTISEWIAAFKKWSFPNWIMIPIAVMTRFLPAVKEDYQQIKKAMAFRGIGSNFIEFIQHPVQTLEYILIPLLMNATQVAEDLTISALTKGLSIPGKHTSIVKLKTTIYDRIYLLLLITPLIIYFGGNLL